MNLNTGIPLPPVSDALRAELAERGDESIRISVAISTRTAAVLAEQGAGLSLSGPQLASLLLNGHAELVLKPDQGSVGERIRQLLERYGLTIFSGTRMLGPGYNPGQLLDEAALLKTLHETTAVPADTWIPYDQALETIRAYGGPRAEQLSLLLDIPIRWLAGEAVSPARPWPKGLSGDNIARQLEHPVQLLLITTRQGQMHAGRVLVAAQVRVPWPGTPEHDVGAITHIKPIGTVNLNAQSQRLTLMAMLYAHADSSGVYKGASDAIVSAELFTALEEGRAHPDDHIQALKDAPSWNAWRLTITDGHEDDVNWISAEDKEQAKLMVQSIEQLNASLSD